MIILNDLDLNFSHFLCLALIASLGGFIRGFAGFGTTLIMVPLFSLLIPPTEAVLIGLSIDVLAMAPLLPNAIRNAYWKPIIPIFIGSIVATPIGVWILIILSPETMRIVIATLVIGSACLLLSGWTYKGRKTNLLSFTVGVFAGTTGSAAAIGGPPIAIYLLAQGLTASKIRASLNATSFFKEGISAISIFFAASFDYKYLAIVLTLFPFMLFSSWIG